MYSKALKPEIMRTMLPKDFPADRLSKPQYKVRVERDIMITMRDGTLIAANNPTSASKPAQPPGVNPIAYLLVNYIEVKMIS